MEAIVRLGFSSEFEVEGEYLDGDIIETDHMDRPTKVRSTHTGRMWVLHYSSDDDTGATEVELG